MKRYPAECPVFRFRGSRDVVAVPFVYGDGLVGCGLAEEEFGGYFWLYQHELKPLTRAARELLAWSRQ